jgi:hypothetical protein
MAIRLKNAAGVNIYAGEESTLVITATFFDENDDPVTPKTANWTLSDLDGTVINTRSDVDLAAVLATEIDIALSGDDLALQNATDTGRRAFLVKSTYDSALGNDLPLNEETQFDINDFVKIS